MPGFKLQTPEGEMVGFLMLEGKESAATGANPRDCIFMSVPARVELVEHELNVFLSENRNTEFRCSFSQSGQTWEGTIPITGTVQVQLSCAVSQTGWWRVRDGEEHELSGQCRLL